MELEELGPFILVFLSCCHLIVLLIVFIYLFLAKKKEDFIYFSLFTFLKMTSLYILISLSAGDMAVSNHTGNVVVWQKHTAKTTQR